MNQSIFRKYGLAVAVALAASGSVGAQTTLGIIDRGRLADTRRQIAVSRSGEEASVSVMVRYANADALAALEAAGATVLHKEATAALVAMPSDRVEELLQTPGIRSASLARRVRKLNDKAREVSNVNAVHAGEGLDRAYKGDGVIVGIFDMGFDPNHITFNDSEGNSRVKHMNTYFQRYEGVAPTVSRNETPSAIARFSTDSSDDTHATHVMGTAAGSFVSGDGTDYSGVAPEAEIFMCGGYGSTDEMTIAFADMTEYAASVGKPLVINLSLGDNEGAHDGTDEFSVMLDEIAERTGAHFFLASGNEGSYDIGIYKEFKSGDTTLRTCLQPDDSNSYYSYPTEGNIEIWSEDATPFKLYIDLVDLTAPSEPVTSIEIPQNGGMFFANGTTPTGVSSNSINRGDTQFNSVYSQSYIGAETEVSAQNGRFYSVVRFDLTSRSTSTKRNYRMALRVEGSEGQKVYGYVNTSYYDSVYGYEAYFPVSFASCNLAGYSSSDGNGSISGMACGHNTIAVGAYVTRNIPSDKVYGGEQPIGEPAYFSSWGNLPGGRVKPDISAPGFLIVSSMSGPYVTANNRYLSSLGTPKYYQYTDPATSKTHYWTYMAGTSMATPFMTGVAALWLEANPSLSTEDIRTIARATAIMPENDNPQWGGSGKVDALAGLKMALNYSGVADVKSEAGKETIIISPKGGSLYEVFAPGDENIVAEVYSLAGGSVAKAEGRGTVDLDLSALSGGVYLLKATTGRSTRSVKIAL